MIHFSQTFLCSNRRCRDAGVELAACVAERLGGGAIVQLLSPGERIMPVRTPCCAAAARHLSTRGAVWFALSTWQRSGNTFQHRNMRQIQDVCYECVTHTLTLHGPLQGQADGLAAAAQKALDKAGVCVRRGTATKVRNGRPAACRDVGKRLTIQDPGRGQKRDEECDVVFWTAGVPFPVSLLRRVKNHAWLRHCFLYCRCGC